MSKSALPLAPLEKVVAVLDHELRQARRDAAYCAPFPLAAEHWLGKAEGLELAREVAADELRRLQKARG